MLLFTRIDKLLNRVQLNLIVIILLSIIFIIIWDWLRECIHIKNLRTKEALWVLDLSPIYHMQGTSMIRSLNVNLINIKSCHTWKTCINSTKTKSKFYLNVWSHIQLLLNNLSRICAFNRFLKRIGLIPPYVYNEWERGLVLWDYRRAYCLLTRYPRDVSDL